MKTSFRKARWQLDSDGYWLMLNVGKDACQFCSEMKPDKKYDAELKEHREKRSNDANNYFWVLCGKLANKVGIPKEDVYRELIRDIGDNFEILPIRNEAVEKWVHNWKKRGLGWVCDIVGESKIDGYTNVMTYYGSSSYDTRQMSTLISFIVEECKAQGIETMTPAELSLLMQGWENE